MGRTHDITISAFDLDRLEKELEQAQAQLREARLNLLIIKRWAESQDLVTNLVLTACNKGLGHE